MTCQHQHDVDFLLQLNAARPNPSTAEVVGVKQLVDRKKVSCQQECGEQSPYHDVDVDLTSHEDAAALLRHENVLLETFSELGRDVRSKLKRLVSRS